MAFLENFDATKVDPSKALEPVPAGRYLGAMTESEMKPTQKGDGSYLACAFQVIDGEHKGRKLYDNLNLKNPNTTAVEIARGKLSAICHAVGVMQPRDSTELHNKPLILVVGHEKRSDNGELKNVIKGYEPRGQAAPAPGVRGALPQRNATPPTRSAPPTSTNRPAPFRRPAGGAPAAGAANDAAGVTDQAAVAEAQA